MKKNRPAEILSFIYTTHVTVISHLHLGALACHEQEQASELECDAEGGAALELALPGRRGPATVLGHDGRGGRDDPSLTWRRCMMTVMI
jgi:hypothetical protein